MPQYELKNWSVCDSPLADHIDPCYFPPELRRRSVQGILVSEHPRFERGDWVTSSPVEGARGRICETASGSTYVLVGPPDPDFVVWCQEHGVQLDPDHPFASRTPRKMHGQVWTPKNQ